MKETYSLNPLKKTGTLLSLTAIFSFLILSCGVLLDVDITASKTSGPAPLSVDFASDTSGYAGIINYYWDFDDGEISYEKNPTHVFADPGTYSVTCEASNEDNTVKASIEIVVSEP